MTTVYKNGIIRTIIEGRLPEYLANGWTTDPAMAKEEEEQIVLRPPVKSKGTAKQSLDNANIGD